MQSGTLVRALGQGVLGEVLGVGVPAAKGPRAGLRPGSQRGPGEWEFHIAGVGSLEPNQGFWGGGDIRGGVETVLGRRSSRPRRKKRRGAPLSQVTNPNTEVRSGCLPVWGGKEGRFPGSGPHHSGGVRTKNVHVKTGRRWVHRRIKERLGSWKGKRKKFL